MASRPRPPARRSPRLLTALLMALPLLGCGGKETEVTYPEVNTPEYSVGTGRIGT